jgi:hypothetical protein
VARVRLEDDQAAPVPDPMTAKQSVASAILKSIDKPPRTKRYGRKWPKKAPKKG